MARWSQICGTKHFAPFYGYWIKGYQNVSMRPKLNQKSQMIYSKCHLSHIIWRTTTDELSLSVCICLLSGLRESVCLVSHDCSGLCSTFRALVGGCFFCCAPLKLSEVWQFAQLPSPTSTCEADKDLSEGLSACLILKWLRHSSLALLAEICFLLTTISSWTAKSSV